MLALLALLALKQRGADSARSDKRRSITGNGDDEIHAASTMRPLTAVESAACCNQGIVRVPLGMWPRSPKGRHVAVDETWIFLAECSIRKTAGCFCPRLVIGNEDVRFCDKLPKRLPARVRRKIGHNAPFTPIPNMKSGRAAHGVALWVFDLDGLSPLLGKEHARVRGCYALGTFKDAYACECSCHGRFPSYQIPASVSQASLPTASRRWENPSRSIIRISPRTIRWARKGPS